MVTVPTVAVLEAASVSVLVLVVDVGLKFAVTPVGTPLALNATEPVNPPLGVTVMVLVPLAPWFTVTLAGIAESVKFGVAVEPTVSVTVVAWLSEPLVPVTATVVVPSVAQLAAAGVAVLVPVVA